MTTHPFPYQLTGPEAGKLAHCFRAVEPVAESFHSRAGLFRAMPGDITHAERAHAALMEGTTVHAEASAELADRQVRAANTAREIYDRLCALVDIAIEARERIEFLLAEAAAAEAMLSPWLNISMALISLPLARR